MNGAARVVGRVAGGAGRRARERRARRALGTLRVGRWPHVTGSPIVTALDAVAGDSLQVLSVERTTLFQGTGRLRIGDGVIFNAGVRIDCMLSVTISDYAIIGVDTMIADSDMHGVGGDATRASPVVVGEGVWVGARCTILPGVTIGPRAVIGTGSMVTKDVPAETVWAGNPARMLRSIEIPDGQVRAWNLIPPATP